MHEELSELAHSLHFQIESNVPILPSEEGILVFYNQITVNSIVAYSNNIQRRYNELLKEPRIIETSHFYYVLVEGDAKRKYFRQQFKNKFISNEWDEKGNIPKAMIDNKPL
ncbi:hypothetical protein GCM10008018_24060 [Paenibacillus marchantiophytorum]|uniref:Uncharacterized protein n=1 Tax=Paenibacillus marchantiophytorum TaxID=1619310 RepID=A0ABQ1EME2_9BACL|nr:hypothetical protein [Paenibacillus marchantiophytorum]GFZ77655.1 hypothetical protein GCM10008018_24060 [Paenibacillus marchantiophytorum]